MVDPSLFSSARHDWATPRRLFAYLDARFHFGLDVCANDYNYKCRPYFTKEEDGLSREWTFVDTAFNNPPYLKPERACKPGCIKKKCRQRGYHLDKDEPGTYAWMKKSLQEATMGMTVVCLVPARTDVDWWHDFCMKSNEVWFLKHRVHFTTPEKPEGAPAPFPSAVVIFDGLHRKLPARPVFRSMYFDKKLKEYVIE